MYLTRWNRSSSTCSFPSTQPNTRPWLWDYSTALAGRWGKADNEYVVSLVFLGLNMVFENVLHLPFSLYSQFVVEAKHGFNKQTLGDFFLGACLPAS
jgi:hypothetical protein